MSKYTLESGRVVYRDGKPFVFIGRHPLNMGFAPEATEFAFPPQDADSFAHEIVAALNPKPDNLAGARDQARLQYESIKEKLDKLEAARDEWPIYEARGDKFARREDIESGESLGLFTAEELNDFHGREWIVLDAGEELDEDEARQAIDESPLSVEVRSNWYTPSGDADSKPYEFMILLCTGGPAVRIIGTLDSNLEPDKARIEFQDWGTPWTEWHAEGVADDFDKIDETLLAYARCFYYGEG